MSTVQNILLIIAIMIVGLLAQFLISQFLIYLAIRKVIKLFRRYKAVGPTSGRTRDELGLQPQSWFDRMMKMRDYRPQALQLLISMGVIKENEDGRLYLFQEKLITTRWKNL